MNFRRIDILIRMLIPAVMLYAAAAMFINGGRLRCAQERLLRAQLSVQQLAEENRELSECIQSFGEPDEMGRLARTRLGFLMPEDRIFYDLGN